MFASVLQYIAIPDHFKWTVNIRPWSGRSFNPKRLHLMHIDQYLGILVTGRNYVHGSSIGLGKANKEFASTPMLFSWKALVH